MNKDHDLKKLSGITMFCGMGLLFLCLITLSGWIFSIRAFTTFHPNWPSIKVNTIFCFAIFSLLLLPGDRLSTTLTTLLISILIVFLLLTLSQYWFDFNLGIDQLLFNDKETAIYPGRMSYFSAVGLLFLTFSVLIIKQKPHKKILPDVLALGALGIAYFCLTSYLYSISGLHAFVKYSGFPFYTAIGFLFVSVGILSVNASKGLFRIFLAKTSSARTGFRLLIIMIALPPLIGLLCLKGEYRGYFDTEFGLELMVLILSVIAGILIWINTANLNRAQDNKFKELLNAAPDPTVIVNEEGIIEMLNDQLKKIFGYRQHELEGKPVELLMPGAYRIKHTAHVKAFVKEPKTRQMGAGFELEAARKDGSKFPVEISLSPLKTDEGMLITAAIRDITERKKIEAQLTTFNEELKKQVGEQTRLLRETFERISDGFIAFDKEYQVTYLNDKGAEIMGRQRDSLIGHNLLDEFPNLSGSLFWLSCEKAMKTQQQVNVEIFQEKTERWYEDYIYPSSDGISVYFKEVTAKKEAENKLRESEEKFATAFYNNVVGVILTDASSRIIDFNTAFEEMVGYTIAELSGKISYEILQPGTENGMKSLADKINEKGELKNIEMTLKTKTGKVITVLMCSAIINLAQGQGRITTIIDISEKKVVEENLKKTNDDLHELSTHLLDVKEDERKNIAREIHDELGQRLTALKMDISLLKKKLPASDETIVNQFKGVLKYIDHTVGSVRRIATSLRPAVLDDFGLVAALEWQTHEVSSRTDTRIFFTTTFKDLDINPDIATSIFRIYQEALNNALKYAMAKEIHSALSMDDGYLILTIKDDGKGFELDAGTKKRTYGLLGMQERAKLFNGSLVIITAIDKGTVIKLSIPFKHD